MDQSNGKNSKKVCKNDIVVRGLFAIMLALLLAKKKQIILTSKTLCKNEIFKTYCTTIIRIINKTAYQKAT